MICGRKSIPLGDFGNIDIDICCETQDGAHNMCPMPALVHAGGTVDPAPAVPETVFAIKVWMIDVYSRI
jgi:hypothetical protein